MGLLMRRHRPMMRVTGAGVTLRGVTLRGVTIR
jgi:hypothetical protein